MKATFNYYYGSQVISKSVFEANVPENWEDEVIDFEFSWGYYKAVQRD